MRRLFDRLDVGVRGLARGACWLFASAAALLAVFLILPLGVADSQGGGVVLGVVCIALAAFFAWYARSIVPEIMRETNPQPFLSRLVLPPLKMAIFMTLVVAILDLFEGGGTGSQSRLMSVLQIVTSLCAAHGAWRLERFWYPERDARPIFGRWLQGGAE